MKHKSLLVGIAVFAALTLSGCSMFYPNPTPTPTPTKTATETPTPTPTETPDPGLNKIDVRIIDASAFIDNGYVDVVAEALNVLEDDGKCTLTLSQGKSVQKITVAAVQNVNTTVCNEMHISLSNFKTTAINYSVTYSSSKSIGTSESGTVEIQ